MSSQSDSDVSLTRTKGCLKSSRTSPKKEKEHPHVAWCSEDEGLEHVYTADDWDRTAVEPAHQPLSDSDILELKAIQQTLPLAHQLPDPYTGKPGKQYLTRVPIVLLPLGPS
ncbi:hypothetical protein E1B28_007037 [Marasmius oreades]|uniref:Uncharacterized protein n=1 Tax=Marasmius oreades TaxID=181124 RepID=A0A9P7S0V1_9AGAR|nr:uncharacterized protein E1B28_007037 [Marasmius oreades]KAG7093356.1 hypothetical protein E1B28_007037 [Marasmius oreades]